MNNPKICVVYYSLTGNTEFIAEIIAEEVNANLIKIRPKKEIKQKGLLRYLWAGKQILMKETPEIYNLEEDLNKYDIIIIGTPVWAYTFSPPIRGFFSKVSLKNKKVALFCTFDGNKGNVLSRMEKELIKDKIIGEESFLRVKNNHISAEQIAKEWARKIVMSAHIK